MRLDEVRFGEVPVHHSARASQVSESTRLARPAQGCGVVPLRWPLLYAYP